VPGRRIAVEGTHLHSRRSHGQAAHGRLRRFICAHVATRVQCNCAIRSLEAHRLVQAILPCRVRNDRQPAILWYAEWPGHGMQSMAYLGTERINAIKPSLLVITQLNEYETPGTARARRRSSRSTSGVPASPIYFRRSEFRMFARSSSAVPRGSSIDTDMPSQSPGRCAGMLRIRLKRLQPHRTASCDLLKDGVR